MTLDEKEQKPILRFVKRCLPPLKHFAIFFEKTTSILAISKNFQSTQGAGSKGIVGVISSKIVASTGKSLDPCPRSATFSRG
jgi:hypothetical protein